MIYRCVYGWKQFFTTHPNHWCRIKSEGFNHPVENGTISFNFNFRKVYCRVIENDTDVPSDSETNFMGFIDKT